jgi:hypothetical protein
MGIATLSRTVRRLTASIPAKCPLCRSWPTEITLRIIEEIIEVGQPLPPPDQTDPTQFGPCPGCGRVHRARVVAIVEDC